jgi:hypothetical protein
MQSKNESLNETVIRLKEELHQVTDQKNRIQSDLQHTLRELSDAQRKQSVAEASSEMASKVSGSGWRGYGWRDLGRLGAKAGHHASTNLKPKMCYHQEKAFQSMLYTFQLSKCNPFVFSILLLLKSFPSIHVSLSLKKRSLV